MRTLKNGTQISSSAKATTHQITTKCPEKWALIDMETGNVYVPNTNRNTKYDWMKASLEQVELASQVAGDLAKSLNTQVR